MRFVTPDVERIALKNDEWIEVKKELSVGEEKRFRSAGFKAMTTTPTAAGDGGAGQPAAQTTAIDVDWARLAIARVEAYLVDWSATRTVRGKVQAVPVTRAAIESLAQEDFEEIDDAIQAHIARMAELKNGASATESSPPPSS